MESEQLKKALIRLNDRIVALEKHTHQPDGGIGTLESAELDQLMTALVQAQFEMEVAGKTAPGYNFKYADIEEIMRASRPALTKHGLAVVQRVHTHTNNNDYLYTRLGHVSGQFMETRTRIRPEKEGNQAFGAAVSYMRRYAYMSIIGLATADEIDIDNVRTTKGSHGTTKHSSYYQ